MSTVAGVDSVGSCVGQRGMRIQGIVNELAGEKIDVVEWNSEIRTYISNALSPAQVDVVILEGDNNVKTATVVVPDRQFALAIGKAGQNPGWRPSSPAGVLTSRASPRLWSRAMTWMLPSNPGP